MIPVRIFISGNEERAKWHLPVVEAKFRSFVLNCQRRGLKQNSFQLNFEEDGTVAEGQYHYGTGSIQIHSPVKITTIQEESKDDLSVEVKPKTFWVNTSKGYYWVEVRYVEGVPRVILTAFNGQSEDGTFIYPGLGAASPGMIAGNFDDTAETRYVLTQDGVVLTGTEEEKGTILSTEIINSGRITPVATVGFEHEYVLMLQNGGQTTEVRRVKISFVDSEISVEREYASLNMSLEGETFPPEVLNTLPAWVHRKCTGSYFSPNKTIGYHMDIGTDDDFMGNIFAARGLDLLDNTGGFEESLFNHTWDLYRIAGMLSFPVSVSDNTISFYAVSPTMGFDDDPENSQKCWGGYELTIDWCGCADYRGDFSSWFLAPRIILVSVDLSTGEFAFTDEAKYAGVKKSIDVFSWDEKFQGTFVLKTETSCDSDFYTTKDEESEANCTWSEACGVNCDAVLGYPSTGECPKMQQPILHWIYYFRENIKITRHAVFIFGKEAEYTAEIETFPGYYFLFDGLWHLDVGVLWTTMPMIGNACSVCAWPPAGQEPGENIYFSVHGPDHDWIMSHGHEYTENLTVVAPLGYWDMPHAGGTSERFGFIAKVPESLEPPHPPEILIGGIEFPSPDVEGEVVKCQRQLSSVVCDCTTRELAWNSAYSIAHGSNNLDWKVVSGCGPYEWMIKNGNFLTSPEKRIITLQDEMSFYADPCDEEIIVVDACRRKVNVQSTLSIGSTITGNRMVKANTIATFTTDFDIHGIRGALPIYSSSSRSVSFSIPDLGEGGSHTMYFKNVCGQEIPLNLINVSIYCNYGVPMGEGTFPGVGAYVKKPSGIGYEVYQIGAFWKNVRLVSSSFAYKWGRIFGDSGTAIYEKLAPDTCSGSPGYVTCTYAYYYFSTVCTPG